MPFLPPDVYAVFGNPVAHSKSPRIHAFFAEKTRQKMRYEARLIPPDGLILAIRQFMEEGGKGLNITLPFKEEAFRFCEGFENALSPRALLAGAVNTLIIQGGQVAGDNTDGAGLVRDIEANLGFTLKNRRVLLLGAGGAARGAIAPLLERQPLALTLANRTLEKAQTLVAAFSPLVSCPLLALPFSALNDQAFDLVINATSASLSQLALPLPDSAFAPGSLAYDMMYGKGVTPFLFQAKKAGASKIADGLGMLLEQAAESFERWRGIRPETGELLQKLRHDLPPFE